MCVLSQKKLWKVPINRWTFPLTFCRTSLRMYACACNVSTSTYHRWCTSYKGHSSLSLTLSLTMCQSESRLVSETRAHLSQFPLSRTLEAARLSFKISLVREMQITITQRDCNTSRIYICESICRYANGINGGVERDRLTWSEEAYA